VRLGLTTRVGNMPELIRDGENGFFVERDVAARQAPLPRRSFYTATKNTLR